MSNEKSQLSNSTAQDEATDWYFTLSSKAVTARERHAFRKWLQENPAHEAAFRDNEAFWRTRDDLKTRIAPEDSDLAARLDMLIADAHDPLPHRGSVMSFSHRPESARPTHRLLSKWTVGGAGIAIAASAMAFVFFGGWFSTPVPINVFETETGQRLSVALTDKSVIQLNSQSKVEILYSAGERRIKLEQGEAVFSVAKNPARPFIVETAAGHVTALGTVFGVRVQDKGTKVIVLEGIVRVDNKNEDNDNRAASTLPGDASRTAPPENKLVRAYQTTEIGKDITPVTTLTKDIAGRTVSWREGRLEYLGEPLAYVVEDLNRYRKDKLIIADASIKDTPVGGSFHTDNTNFLLFVLQNEYGVKVVHVTPYLTLLFKAT